MDALCLPTANTKDNNKEHRVRSLSSDTFRGIIEFLLILTEVSLERIYLRVFQTCHYQKGSRR